MTEFSGFEASDIVLRAGEEAVRALVLVALSPLAANEIEFGGSPPSAARGHCHFGREPSRVARSKFRNHGARGAAMRY
jgi:hypothetical protein